MPVTLSRSSSGTTKEVRGVSGSIWPFGMTKAATAEFAAPDLASLRSHSTTLKKCVGTAVVCGGLPAHCR